MNDIDQRLGDLVVANPAAARIFQRYRLDYCCGGRQSLREACAAAGLDPTLVLGELSAAALEPKTQPRWEERPLAELVTFIVDHYHAALRAELPRLITLAAQVEEAHAGKPDCPDGLADLLVEVYAAVESHLVKEEQILFPLIVAGRGRTAHMPVQVMMQEHEDHGRDLRRIRALTGDLRLPADACASWRELYRALDALERDLVDHIHLENNILFPRALAA